ncbi:hypothetical protein V8B97DRAFT_2024397 [Scleroderma yunnanense]
MFSSSTESKLSVLINQIDYTLAPPGSLDNSSLHRVPIIRIYGTSSTGQKACVHIHQVYPYFFVEYTAKVTPDNVHQYITKLSLSLNHAIALSLKRNPSKSQYIRAIVLVKGVHFYGFHSSYTPFLKIHLVDPALMNRAVTLMRSGTIMRTKFPVFESHLSYLLQFMCDFGLYGCGWINLGEVWERCPESQDPLITPPFMTSPYCRQSRMSLEVDAVAGQILNRHQLQARNMHNRLTIPAPLLPSEPLVLSVRELWEDERQRRINKGLSPTPPLQIDFSKSSRGCGGDWVAEAHWWEELKKKIEEERHNEPLVFENHDSWETWVMTTFESVEALWEPQFRTWKPVKRDVEGVKDPEDSSILLLNASEAENPFVTWNGTLEDAEADVDETLLSSQDIDQIIAGGEREWADDVGEDGDFDDPVDDGQAGEDPIPHQFEVDGKVVPHEGGVGRAFHAPEKVSKISIKAFYHVDDTCRVPRLSTIHDTDATCNPFLITGDGLVNSRVPRASYGASMVTSSYYPTPQRNSFVYVSPPPTISELLNTIEDHGLPRKMYRDPFYSKAEDVPYRPREYAGLVYHLKGDVSELGTLEEWQSKVFVPLATGDKSPLICPWGWEYLSCPPSRRQIKMWLKDNPPTVGKRTSQVEWRTQGNLYGLKPALPKRTTTSTREGQHMTLLSLEVFAPSRGDRLPDPSVDEIAAVFYALGDDNPNSGLFHQGILALECEQFNPQRLRCFPLEISTSELELINRFIDIVIDLDPDIVLGWEVQVASWGYLSARGNQYGLDVAELISRAPSNNSGNDNDRWGEQSTSTFKVTGRHVFNVWRIMRSEQNLNIYTFENVAFHVLRRRVPRYKPSTLTAWFESPISAHTSRVLRHFLDRTSMNLDILEELDITTKTAEFARVFGVDFYSVISRGSQFKVESFMFRIAKPECFVLLSPSKQDVGKQNAAECMPLIMEPLSAFYKGPLVVLDFQSLYPSVMIAYNYCYSTCLGRIIDFQGRNKFGVTDLQRPAGLLEKLWDHITIAPNGIIYVKPVVRQGLLGRMLTELLDTRVMVKQAMKSAADDKVLRRVLDARQLGLKYIANVTYGYTSATYSGRMPAVEIADSIVQSGRETLEKAINIIDATDKWGAQVVYGDTDSLFIYLKGKTKEQAFRIGQDMADTITAMNPPPVKLKFEKVYLPCVLLAKKRYVGFKFESPDEESPTFDAKGIETVRRDGVIAQAKMTETCLKTLFRTQDLSQVKKYCCWMWSKILRNKAFIQDFIFAKEVKMGTYSEKGPPPPGVAVAARRMLNDPNDEPQYGERVPYIISRDDPHKRLVERAVTPEELLANPHMHIDAVYYIEKVLIPPLERIFNLVGANVRAWYEDMPKAIEVDQRDPLLLSPKKPTIIATDRYKIDEHFQSSHCLSCDCPASEGICEDCLINPQHAIPNLLRRLHKGEKRLLETHRICTTCTSNELAEPIECLNTDCPWLYERKKTERKTEFLEGLRSLIENLDFDESEGESMDMFL